MKYSQRLFIDMRGGKSESQAARRVGLSIVSMRVNRSFKVAASASEEVSGGIGAPIWTKILGLDSNSH